MQANKKFIQDNFKDHVEYVLRMMMCDNSLTYLDLHSYDEHTITNIFNIAIKLQENEVQQDYNNINRKIY